MSIVLNHASRSLMRSGRASLQNSTTTIFRPILAFNSSSSIYNYSAYDYREISSKHPNEAIATDQVESPFIPRSDRTPLQPSLYRVAEPGNSRILRASRLCPTRDLNFTPQRWAVHKAPGRHLRHLVTVFGCASFQRLVFPDLFLTATIAAGLTYYNMTILGGIDPFAFDTTAFTSCSMGISVLAGFRLNTSYGRFNEARIIWGQVNNTSRDLMGQACMFLNEKSKQRMKKLLKAYPVAMHFHLNTKGGHFKLNSEDPKTKQKVNAAYRDEMREIFVPGNEMLNDKDTAEADLKIIYEAYESGAHAPLFITSLMRKTIMEHDPPIDNRFVVSMIGEITNLLNCLGGCERLLRTPIPTTYTLNTSRLMSLWSLTLPLGLYPLTGPQWTLPFSVLLSYVVLSIEDVGVEIEEPFHVLPLRQFTEGIADSIEAIEKAYAIIPESTNAH
mmetsp:Transcript_28390/g.59716  ORF Transcript_28390/g.59716 Transcript_28390/m.59716 type:complete len:445 (-) Transcript_28390:195-1529(-)